MPILADAKLEAFAQAYARKPVAAEAARRAGHRPESARQWGYEQLQRAEVIERIDELVEERARRVEVDANDILRELMRIALADPAEIFDECGKSKLIHDVPLEIRRVISGIEAEEMYEWQGSGDERERVHVGTRFKYKLWNKERGLEMLARHLALFRDTLTLNAKGETEVDDNAIAARVAAILRDWQHRADQAKDLL